MKATQYLSLILGSTITLLPAVTSLPRSDTNTKNNNNNTTLLPRGFGEAQKTPPAFIPDYTTAEAGNPFLPDYYTTPDVSFHEGKYWVFAAPSSPSAGRCFQHYFDAFSSPDMVHWTKHAKVLSRADYHPPGVYQWAACDLLSPYSVARGGKYYLYFAAGDPEHDLSGGVGVGVADRPEGPYRDPIGGPLVHARVQQGRGPDLERPPRLADPSALVDEADGGAYLYYTSHEPGGGSKVVVVGLKDDMVSFGGGAGGTSATGGEVALLDVTPRGSRQFAGAARVFQRKGKYYMLWSEGDAEGADYRVAWAVSTAGPMGPWERNGTVIEKDDRIATGTGHASVVNVPGTDVWYLYYSRRQLGEYTDPAWCGVFADYLPWCRRPVEPDQRVVAYERLTFAADGAIKPVAVRVRDNFDDGNADGWTPYTSGEYSVQNGQLRGSRGIAALNTNLWDVVAEARVTLESTRTKDGNAGLVVRMRPHQPHGPHAPALHYMGDWKGADDYEGTYAGISTADGGKAVLGVASYGKWYPLAEARMPVELGRAYLLRVTARGGTVRFFVDDMRAPRAVSECVDDGSQTAGFPEQPLCRHFQDAGGKVVVWENMLADVVGNVGVRVFEATAAFDEFRAARYDQACATNGDAEGCV